MIQSNILKESQLHTSRTPTGLSSLTRHPSLPILSSKIYSSPRIPLLLSVVSPPGNDECTVSLGHLYCLTMPGQHACHSRAVLYSRGGGLRAYIGCPLCVHYLSICQTNSQTRNFASRATNEMDVPSPGIWGRTLNLLNNTFFTILYQSLKLTDLWCF